MNKGSSPPDNTTTLLPTTITYPSHRTPALCNLPTFPRFVAALVEKQYSNYTNNNNTADDSQLPIFSDDKLVRQFDDEISYYQYLLDTESITDITLCYHSSDSSFDSSYKIWDNFINNNNTADNSQPSILVGDRLFDDKPSRDFDDAIYSKIMFDLAAKITLDNTMNTTEYIVVDDIPNRKSNNDDDLVIDNCTLKFFGLAPPPEHPQYKPQYDHFSSHPQSSTFSVPSDSCYKKHDSFYVSVTSPPPPPPPPQHSECNPFCKGTRLHDVF